MTDETTIRELITRWVGAVATCDQDGVVTDHDDAIVMFDVPPPYDGVRGIDAYRDSWPPFFDYIRSGARFELLELSITAGADVAFAYGLLRCSTDEDFAANPDNRLRLTMGLRKQNGHWSIAHEHHSFCMPEDA
ncbi:nuclear transport factor 2 family protein [Mycolicibacterium sp. S2-37]|uniref:YybH family protein n=1 Tax=Mycolicibacterium sp. S2-37 TaxID=2810297 RepID=UPI001A942A21|nr:nuclear transport factor 2 family protein [Mycolicibacterium sp. S2-37]MBO0679588.1 nuclear transport factor 2 family protein [Mycolicibacterium sp. S2-37]